MHKKTHLLLLFVVSLLTLLVFLFLLSPDKLPLYGLFIPFAAIFLMTYALVRLLINKTLTNINSRGQAVLSASIAALPIALLILQSSGQISANDSWLFGILAILLIFYFRKTDFLK